MSITASGPPPAATLPLAVSCAVRKPVSTLTVMGVEGSCAEGFCDEGFWGDKRFSLLAAALRYTELGRKKLNRLSPLAAVLGAAPVATSDEAADAAPDVLALVRWLPPGIGSSAGNIWAATSTSMPTILMTCFCPSAVNSYVLTSSTGLATSMLGCCATRAYKFSSRLPLLARSSRSGWPLTERTALENSLKALALIKCTANASATPSMMATTAAALRHGWCNTSRHEKVPSS